MKVSWGSRTCRDQAARRLTERRASQVVLVEGQMLNCGNLRGYSQAASQEWGGQSLIPRGLQAQASFSTVLMRVPDGNQAQSTACTLVACSLEARMPKILKAEGCVQARSQSCSQKASLMNGMYAES
jgi:hypothetical protein